MPRTAEPQEVTRAHEVFTERYRDLVACKFGYWQGGATFDDLCANYDAAKTAFDTWMDAIRAHRAAEDHPHEVIDP